MKKGKNDSENKKLCGKCTTCCEYVTVELDKPKTKIDFEEIIWFILHDKVIVYIDDENTWNIEFKTKCKKLGKNGLCGLYKDRPEICKDYGQDECERYGDGDYYKVLFKTKKDVLDYVGKNTKLKGIN